ncbi:MAG: Mut7-C RNAse domain-containing protein [Syntrophorhabdales bacterium]|jgi:uncharacterized protein with PIN domain
MRFVCDAMLGKLAKYLRLLGFDAAYAAGPAALDGISATDPGRILLTRRRGGHAGFARTIRIESEIAQRQLREIKALIKPEIKRENVCGRCIECNVELIEVEKADVESLVPEFVFHAYARFRTCPSCRRVYWEGTHTRGMETLLKEILD